MNKPITTADAQPNDLSNFWVPFTPNRAFKKAPRLLVSAEGVYYKSHDGRDILFASDWRQQFRNYVHLWSVPVDGGRPRALQHGAPWRLAAPAGCR